MVMQTGIDKDDGGYYHRLVGRIRILLLHLLLLLRGVLEKIEEDNSLTA